MIDFAGEKSFVSSKDLQSDIGAVRISGREE